MIPHGSAQETLRMSDADLASRSGRRPIELTIAADHSVEDAYAQLVGGRQTIFTANLDHFRLLNEDERFRQAYAAANLITLDSEFLRRYFFPSGRVVKGSDLVAVFAERARTAPVDYMVIGNSGPELLERVVGYAPKATFVPKHGFIDRPADVEAITAACKAAAPRVIFIAVGAPRSEILAARLRQAGVTAPSILCCGASFDFLDGSQRRAPPFFQKVGLEWLHRLTTNPGRLGPRYLKDAMLLATRLRDFLKITQSRKLSLTDVTIRFAAPS